MSSSPLHTYQGQQQHSSATDYEAADERSTLSVLWMILLILVACPLSLFLCQIWVVLMALEAFVPPARDMNVWLEQLIAWPRTLSYAIRDGRRDFPAPRLSGTAS